jgi:three-Cys-motif partner protein
LFFNDADSAAVEALRARVGAAAPNVTITGEDCNVAASRARDVLFPSNTARSTLGLAFIDPTAFQIGFDAIARLTEGRRIDVIITVMTSYLRRFIAEPSFGDPLSKYFGSEEWRNLANLRRAGEDVTSRVLLDHYENRSRTLGYEHFDDRIQIRNTRDSTIYHLVFASRHELGSKFFSAISQRGHSGQFQMDI